MLVNVEDVLPLCDFHVPAIVRQGDLLLTASTGGTAPGLARALREHLAESFGPEWRERLADLAQERARFAARPDARRGFPESPRAGGGEGLAVSATVIDARLGLMPRESVPAKAELAGLLEKAARRDAQGILETGADGRI